jgi:hypothetical protein
VASKAIDFVFSQSTVLEFGRETLCMGVRSSGFVSSGGRVCDNQKVLFLKNDPACEIREKDGGACALMVPAFGRSFS